MRFLKTFIFNLGMLLVGGLVLYMIFPELMSSIIELYGVVLGPLAIVILLVVAIPRKRRR